MSTELAPFPNQTRQGLPVAASCIPVPERGQIIPASYAANPHPEPEKVVVKQEGVPILSHGRPFTVADVAPERRWAVGLDGEVMDQSHFSRRLEQIREEWYAWIRTQPGRQSAQYRGNHQLEPVPNIRKYVSRGVDPDKPEWLRDIHYDPNATAGAKPTVLSDAKGEESRPRMEVLVEAYRSHPERLRPDETAEVEAHLGKTDPQVKLHTVYQRLQAGELTPEQAAAELAPGGGEAAPPAPAPGKPRPKRAAPKKVAMSCGETIYPMHRKRHIAKCEVCT